MNNSNNADRNNNRVTGTIAESLNQIITSRKATEVSISGENSGGVVVGLKLPGHPDHVVRGFIPRSLMSTDNSFKAEPGTNLTVMIKQVEQLRGKTQFVASHREALVDLFIGSLTIGVATSGRVVRPASNRNGQFGWFISLACGIDGLLHASQNERDLEVGDNVAVEIISLDAVERRIGLSTRISNVGDSASGNRNHKATTSQDQAGNNGQAAEESQGHKFERRQRNRSRSRVESSKSKNGTSRETGYTKNDRTNSAYSESSNNRAGFDTACVGSLSKLGDFFPKEITFAAKESKPAICLNWLERKINEAVEELSSSR
ncbi:hypothetical protein BH11CYA1_BH11CYA1_33620 [soil metagenome]